MSGLTALGYGATAFVILIVLYFVRKSGQDQRDAAKGKKDAKIAKKVAEARADGPGTFKQLHDGLRDGTDRL